MCNKTRMRLTYSCNSGGLNLSCSVEKLFRLTVSTKRLRETRMLLYGEQAFVHISSEPDDKEATLMTPLTKCACCNWSVCSQRCQDSPGHNTECQARHDFGISIGVVHFDKRNAICVYLDAMMPLSLPGNIKDLTQ